MRISATIKSSFNRHDIALETDGALKTVKIAPKSTGYGSSVNGGELLLLSLATCYCNDIYREANKRGLVIDSVNVECHADFGLEGEPGANFIYHVSIESAAPAGQIQELIAYTDKVAEIHNTLRKGESVTLLNLSNYSN